MNSSKWCRAWKRWRCHVDPTIERITKIKQWLSYIQLSIRPFLSRPIRSNFPRWTATNWFIMSKNIKFHRKRFICSSKMGISSLTLVKIYMIGWIVIGHDICLHKIFAISKVRLDQMCIPISQHFPMFLSVHSIKRSTINGKIVSNELFSE